MSSPDLVKERLRARLAALKSKDQKKEKRTWSPKDGSMIRALRYTHNADPENEPFAQAWFHYNFPGVKFGIYCPKANQKSDECPACDFATKLLAKTAVSRNKEDYKFAKRVEAQRKTLVPVIDRADTEMKPKLWVINTTIESKLINWLIDVDTDSYLDPINGYDMKVAIVEKQKFKMPDVELGRKQSKLADDEVAKVILSTIPKVEEAFELMSFEKIKSTIEDGMRATAKVATGEEADHEIIKGGGNSEEKLEESSDDELKEAFRSAREPLE